MIKKGILFLVKLPGAWVIGYGCGIVWFGYTAGCGGYLLMKKKN